MAAKRTLEDVRQYLKRTIGVERIVFFVKLAVIGFAFSVVVLGVGPLQGPSGQNVEEFTDIREGSVEQALLRSVQYFKLQLVLYTAVNVIFWIALFGLGRRISSYLFIKTTAFFLVIIDIVFVSLLIWLLPGLQRSLFWLYCFGLVHAVLLFPNAIPMVVMTVCSAAFYTGAVTLSVPFSTEQLPLPRDPRYQAIGEQRAAEAQAARADMILHIVILGMAGAGSWGANTFIQMRLRALREDQERVIRTEKLNLAAMMASNIAHELKNPFAIINNAAYLLRRAEDRLDENLRKQIAIITSEIRRSDKIVTELLGYAKLAGGKIESVSVNRVIDEALKDLQHETTTRRVVIAKAYRRNLPRLLIDRTQLRSMASNLLLNACEAMNSTGKITVTTDYTDDGFISIAIADTGDGISDGDLARVFESSFTTKEGGSGLGLSIVQSIVRAYGGDISVESEQGRGSCFTVRLPTHTARQKR